MLLPTASSAPPLAQLRTFPHRKVVAHSSPHRGGQAQNSLLEKGGLSEQRKMVPEMEKLGQKQQCSRVWPCSLPQGPRAKPLDFNFPTPSTAWLQAPGTQTTRWSISQAARRHPGVLIPPGSVQCQTEARSPLLSGSQESSPGMGTGSRAPSSQSRPGWRSRRGQEETAKLLIPHPRPQPAFLKTGAQWQGLRGLGSLARAWVWFTIGRELSLLVCCDESQ